MRIIETKNIKTSQSVDAGRKRFRAVVDIDIWVPETGNPEQDKTTAMEEVYNISKNMSKLTEFPIRTSVGNVSGHNEL